MLDLGLIEEVVGLIEKGFADWEPLQSVGYKEALGFLQGDPELATPLALQSRIVQNTMRLAKKQKTWFQRDPEIHWVRPDETELFQQQVRDFLKS